MGISWPLLSLTLGQSTMVISCAGYEGDMGMGDPFLGGATFIVELVRPGGAARSVRFGPRTGLTGLIEGHVMLGRTLRGVVSGQGTSPPRRPVSPRDSYRLLIPARTAPGERIVKALPYPPATFLRPA